MYWSNKKSFPLLGLIALCLCLVFAVIGCGTTEEMGVIEDDQSAVTAAAEGESSTQESASIIEATNKYLTSGRAPTISADDLYKKVIQGGDKGYFIISVRKPEDYAKGHIPKAINIPYGQFYKKDNLAKIPKDKKIVVVCYTGHTASQITMFLNQLGYEAYALKYGMAGWTSDPQVLAIKPFTKALGYPTDTTPIDAPAKNQLPEVNTGFTEANDIVIAQTERYLTSGRAPTISAEDVFKEAIEGNNPNYFIVSVRKPEDYAKGHLKGAVNIPYGQAAKEENLKKIPKDKKIVVVCYTGHTASQITMLLNQLGFEAYAMKFGMSGWTDQPEVLNMPVGFKAGNYPVTK